VRVCEGEALEDTLGGNVQTREGTGNINEGTGNRMAHKIKGGKNEIREGQCEGFCKMVYQTSFVKIQSRW
jgi:hypothetical protein